MGGRLTWNEKDLSHPFMTMILTSVTMVGWADVPDSDWGDLRRHRAVDISSLRHWGQDTIAAIFETFLNAFPWMKMYKLRLRFHWLWFQRVQSTIFHHWFRWGLGAGQATSHYLNHWWFVYRCIYVSLGFNELNWSYDWKYAFRISTSNAPNNSKQWYLINILFVSMIFHHHPQWINLWLPQAPVCVAISKIWWLHKSILVEWYVQLVLPIDH